MEPQNKLSGFLHRLIHIDSKDSDDARRRQLLNIILLGVLALTILLVIIITFYVLSQSPVESSSGIDFIYPIAGGLVLGAAIIYLMNRYISGGIASLVFLGFLIAIFNFSDTPDELANGRSILLFCIPIILSSILLRPFTSFIFAAIVSVNISIIAFNYASPPNYPAITVFFLLALASWLSSRSLQQALGDLRQINANLDSMVQERTAELAESLRREQNEAGRSNAILKGTSDGIILFDTRGTVIEANPALVHLLDLPQEEIRSWNIDAFTRSRILDARNRGIIAGLLTNPEQQSSSHRITWKKRTLLVNASPIYDTRNARIGTVAVFRDFTREAEVERMKSSFMAIVSHELRTPLNAITGYAEMLKENIYGPVNEKQARVAERIMSNARRLLDMVKDLLDQAQIESGKLAIQVAPFKVVDLLENVHGVMDTIAAEKDLALSHEIDPALPPVMNGDIARLQQILINLVNNAIKFTRRGSVHISLSPVDKRSWSIQVEDTGVGIPTEEIERIFESFHQVDSSNSREHGGFGLGLSIVRQLAELMGGQVSASSEMGVGSVFTVTLPYNVRVKK